MKVKANKQIRTEKGWVCNAHTLNYRQAFLPSTIYDVIETGSFSPSNTRGEKWQTGVKVSYENKIYILNAHYCEEVQGE